MNSNMEYCKRVAEKVELIASGYAGIDDNDNIIDVCVESAAELYYLVDYINRDVLDIEYILNSNKDLIGVRLYVTLGGPTVWIDTEDCAVKLSWGTETASYGLDWYTCDTILVYFQNAF